MITSNTDSTFTQVKSDNLGILTVQNGRVVEFRDDHATNCKRISCLTEDET